MQGFLGVVIIVVVVVFVVVGVGVGVGVVIVLVVVYSRRRRSALDGRRMTWRGCFYKMGQRWGGVVQFMVFG